MKMNTVYVTQILDKSFISKFGNKVKKKKILNTLCWSFSICPQIYSLSISALLRALGGWPLQNASPTLPGSHAPDWVWPRMLPTGGHSAGRERLKYSVLSPLSCFHSVLVWLLRPQLLLAPPLAGSSSQLGSVTLVSAPDPLACTGNGFLFLLVQRCLNHTWVF